METTRLRSQEIATDAEAPLARVVVVGLASCFGCQLQVTNIEQYLLDLLGRIDLQYWQLTSSDPMPKDFDVAVIEGAVTTEEAFETVKALRERASVLITIGACAATAGIPGMAQPHYSRRAAEVYGAESIPEIMEDAIRPRPVKAVVDVDLEVRCCPIDPMDFVDVLSRVLNRSNKSFRTSTLCGECKRNERGCFWQQGTLCLGLVTRSGCGSRCPSLGRPCNGCAGLSADANLRAAHMICEENGIDPALLDEALTLFNQSHEAFSNHE